MNDNTRYLIQKFNLNETSDTDTTTASTQAYDLPYNCKKLISVTVTVGSQKYTPREITSRDMWNRLNNTTVTSDAVQYYYIYDGQVQFYPIPATTSNTITFYFKKRVRDLTIADYTTGTVSITTDTTAITGSGTTFIADMVGRWIQITAPTGDQEWYEIATFTSTTSIGLKNAYNGATVSGGSYIIGEVSILPEEFQDLPVKYAVKQYYSSRVKDRTIFEMYKSEYDDRYSMMNEELGSKSDNMVIDPGDNYGNSLQNPNNYVTL